MLIVVPLTDIVPTADPTLANDMLCNCAFIPADDPEVDKITGVLKADK